jgi:two-component sensor histidine kinase
MIGVVLVFRDISERKTAQQQREQYLGELEELNSRLRLAMTETHHRVKNNLQLISSMVALHAHEGDGTLSANEVKQLGTNISALAAVQDVLTKASKRGNDVSAVSITELLETLLPIHRQSAPRHEITAQLEDVWLRGTQGTALALLANELLSNAIKHGKSAVHLTMHMDTALNMLEMKVTDDGPGFADGFDPLKAANTGLELIVSLAKWDLRGELSFGNNGEGGEVRLRMPVNMPATS